MKFTNMIMVLAILLGLGTTVQAELTGVLNGSFEDDWTGWHHRKSYTYVINEDAGFADTPYGTNWAELGNGSWFYQQIGFWEAGMQLDVSFLVGRKGSTAFQGMYVSLWVGGDPSLAANSAAKTPTTLESAVGATQIVISDLIIPPLDESETSEQLVELSTGTGYTRGAPLWLLVQNKASGGRTYIDNFVVETPGIQLVSPSPNGAVDVLRDTDLKWASPSDDMLSSYDVYFGMVFDDVNEADRANPLDVLVSENLDTNVYDLDLLLFGQTYYWRVDEINDVPETTIVKGAVWSFTIEPVSIPIPGAEIVVTASSSSDEFSMPVNTVNGSGLDANDVHDIKTEHMWFTAMGDAAPWIQYKFETVMKLDVMKVWNSNSSAEGFVGYGVKGVLIETSVDGQTWSEFKDVNEFSRAPGVPTYGQYDEIDLGGLAAKIVRLSIQSNWGSVLAQYSLSEVRFMFIPAFAREPEPASEATGVAPDAVLSWRAGRGAVFHDIYLGTDINDLSLAKTVSENQASLDDLMYDTTYFWQVVEVNETEEPASYPGDVWSFTTEAFKVVDNFDSYNNDSPNRAFQTWHDGFGFSADEFFAVDYPGNGTGSGVGHDIWSSSSPHYNGKIMEGTITKSGKSMPLYFYNTNGLSVSETKRTFAVGEDWATHGIKSLSLNIYGDPDNSGQLYLKINNTRINYVGLSDALQRQQWIPWVIDLSTAGDVQNVTSLTIGIDGAGATGMIYVDDIRLYPLVLETIAPVVPLDSDPNLVAHYEFEGNANDRTGNYPGTAEGEPTYDTGKIGQAMVFDGIDDQVVNTFAAEELWSAFSVTLWVKTDTFAQVINNSPFNNNSVTNPDFQFDVDGTDPGNYRYAGTGGNVILGPVTSNWTNLAVSCDGTQTSVYYNGIRLNTREVANNLFGQIAIGINRGMTKRFQGMIDDVRVYNRDLSHAEVAGLSGITDVIPNSF